MPTPRRCAHGWYFTGDTGYFDADGDLFVTGRVDDMIITGGENVSPVEIESCLSLHQAVSEVAVVGLPDERWGKIVAAFVKRRARSSPRNSTSSAATSGLANFKRPRRYVFVEAIPKSPVGKLLRRMLVAGEYEPERQALRAHKEPLHEPAAVFADPRLAALDGFRVEIDPAHERADVILDRPPLNVVSMPQRDQLRLVFEAWTRTRACASSCCARWASISPAAATSRASWRRRPRPSPSLPGTSRRRRAAPSR